MGHEKSETIVEAVLWRRLSRKASKLYSIGLTFPVDVEDWKFKRRKNLTLFTSHRELNDTSPSPSPPPAPFNQRPLLIGRPQILPREVHTYEEFQWAFAMLFSR